MSGNRTVAEATKQRIEQAMIDLGYQPNAGARTLRTSQTNVIALIVNLSSDVDGIETVPYLDAVIEGARSRDYDVVFSMASEGSAGLRRLIGRSICDGVLIMDTRRQDPRIETAVELGRPVVLVGEPDDPAGLDVVDFDGPVAARMLVDDLADTGHESLVILVSEDPEYMREFRAFVGFYDAAMERARERGMQAQLVAPRSIRWRDVNALAPTISAAAGSKLGLLTRAPRATEWCLRLLMQENLEVGTDVSIAALCTDEVAGSFGIGITNVSPRPREMITQAVDALFRRMDGSEEPAVLDRLAPIGLTRRESTVRFDLR